MLTVRYFELAMLLLGMAGCGLVPKAYEPHPVPAAPVPVMPVANTLRQPTPRSDGSIWNPDQSGGGLFSDDKAFNKGDIVLVRVIQKTSGSKKANTDTSRKSSISANIKYMLGAEKTINSVTGYKAPVAAAGATGGGTTAWAPNDLINAEGRNAFTGTGATERTDTLQATVSAIVTDVLANGNLMIYGHQTVQLNNEASVLTVQGIIRPSDIGVDNTIDSERLANADIQFTGSGVLTDKQHPGWGTRIFDWVSPF